MYLIAASAAFCDAEKARAREDRCPQQERQRRRIVSA
jgi:hypothetical protein